MCERSSTPRRRRETGMAGVRGRARVRRRVRTSRAGAGGRGQMACSSVRVCVLHEPLRLRGGGGAWWVEMEERLASYQSRRREEFLSGSRVSQCWTASATSQCACHMSGVWCHSTRTRVIKSQMAPSPFGMEASMRPSRDWRNADRREALANDKREFFHGLAARSRTLKFWRGGQLRSSRAYL